MSTMPAGQSIVPGAKRALNVHEFQGAELLGSFGVNVPRGMPARTVAEAEASAALLAKNNVDGEVVVKAQVGSTCAPI